MDLGIRNRSALVCGASAGLGYACALALAQEGVSLVLVSRRIDAITAAADAIAASTGVRCTGIAADLSTVEGRTRVLATCINPDILVTNAGGPPSLNFTELSAEHWQKALDTNLISAVELIRGIAPGMAERGFGRIVNITSATVRMPVEKLDLSTSTRMALTGYVAGVARQLASHGVTINNLLPGTILTDRLDALGEVARKLIEKVPAGRAGTPEEFASACAYLCGASSGFITGQSLLIDGGLCPLTF
jgi:3-oxoacyl-[acyl-carrier protein] reductase